MNIQKPTLNWRGPLTPISRDKFDAIGLHHAAAERLSFFECHEEHRNRIENGSYWLGIGYSYYVQKDGQIFEGRGFNRNAAIGVANDHVLSVCFEGNYEIEASMPNVQLQAGVQLLEWLRPQLPNLKIIEGHRYWMPTACPGKNFPMLTMISGVIQPSTQPSESAPQGFSHPNNARVNGDDLWLRDSDGNRISGRYVSNGDHITVLDISYSKQLVLVEYSTASGVRSGYVRNVCIQYANQDQWQNGSTPEPVFDENGVKIGSLDPHEKATPLYRNNGRLHVVYNTGKGKNTKSGYVAYNGGFSKF